MSHDYHTREPSEPDGSKAGLIAFAITALATLGVAVGGAVRQGDSPGTILMLGVVSLILGALFGAVTLAIHEKFQNLGLDGKWNALTIPLSVALGPTAVVGVCLCFVAMIVGLMLVLGLVLGGLTGNPEMVAAAEGVLMESPYGPVLLVFGVIGLAFGMAPKPPAHDY